MIQSFLGKLLSCFPLDKICLVCVKVHLLRLQTFLFLGFFTAPVVFSPALR
jgi:hypothetical protein